MKAVNLLPHDLRRVSKRASSAPERAGGMGAYVVLGALALCVVALAGYVITSNAVKQRKADLDGVKARQAAVSKQVAALKPYADFDQMAQTRVSTVKGLVAARFDWPQALGDLSRVVPGSVKLSTLTGSMRSGASGGSDPLRAALAAPAVELAGCARSQTGVATLMSRLRGVDGVTRVSLSKSEKAASTVGSTDDGPCGKSGPTFSVVAFFEGNAAAAAYVAPASTTAGSQPVPTAVEAAGGAGGEAAGTPATGTEPTASSTPAAGDTSTTTPTSTSTTPTP